MKRFLDHRSNRFGYDGWAVKVTKADSPMIWTVSTTREEARALRAEMDPDLFQSTEVVKVKITVKVVYE